jgi:regulator of protease activity HflC (stomatin/prohibitin superfamily)
VARQAEAEREKRAKIINAEGGSLAATPVPPPGDGTPVPDTAVNGTAPNPTAGTRLP